VIAAYRVGDGAMIVVTPLILLGIPWGPGARVHL
jgi:hypothetical protein